MARNKAVFVDRDGTINVDVHYLDDPERFQLYPGVGEGIHRLNMANFKVIVVTNQSGIARGYFSLETLEKIHEKMREELRRYNAFVDAIYFCPHHPDDNCHCRKPKTGMFEQAIIEHDIDAKLSFMIGDKILDIIAGKRIGAKTILVPEPHLRKKVLAEREKWDAMPDYIAGDFMDAVNWILKD